MAFSIAGSTASSCWRSASITATIGADDAIIPSMHAPASPRRPTRLKHRTRMSRAAISRTCALVPSGLLSSTKITSQFASTRIRRNRATSSAILPRSLKVGTTMESCGLGIMLCAVGGGERAGCWPKASGKMQAASRALRTAAACHWCWTPKHDRSSRAVLKWQPLSRNRPPRSPAPA